MSREFVSIAATVYRDPPDHAMPPPVRGLLLAWYREGVDVQMRLPELSIYLGHIRPADTYWYLTAIPELLGCAADRFDAFVNARGAS